MEFERVSEVTSEYVEVVFRMTHAEYARFVQRRNKEAEREAQMDRDMARFE